MATLICDLGGVLFTETDPQLRVDARRPVDGGVPAARSGDDADGIETVEVETGGRGSVNLDVLEALSRLRERGWQLIGATDAGPWDDAAARERFGWVLAVFDRVVTSADVRACRPDPRYFAELRNVCRQGARLYVDGNPHHVAAARRAGFDAHVFTSAAALDSACRHLLVAAS